MRPPVLAFRAGRGNGRFCQRCRIIPVDRQRIDTCEQLERWGIDDLADDDPIPIELSGLAGSKRDGELNVTATTAHRD
eukprot:CAMPEP_0119423442 /NCGR_PEP_ID=MMETSP1335-20130426/30312_1 /TAXON_ID=259385 /ORGANISM="Chrysoculter rhomboideus, Strain RCC1486" /LENGTH=77 /DNA_ID=CAMNT_0007448935 /DNA_START=230 /DNA_END=463 /DNA_ORIENTATION=+